MANRSSVVRAAASFWVVTKNSNIGQAGGFEFMRFVNTVLRRAGNGTFPGNAIRNKFPMFGGQVKMFREAVAFGHRFHYLGMFNTKRVR